MFCFPHGLYLQSRRSTDAPLPRYFSFVCTTGNGTPIYVACLCFYETVKAEFADQLRRKFGDVHRPSFETPDVRSSRTSDTDEQPSIPTAGSTDLELPRERKGVSGERRSSRQRMTGDFALYMPKCICLISHNPFYRGMRRFLRQLYSISLSATRIPSRIPIERYISYFVSHLPFPKPGGAKLHVHLDGSLMHAPDHSSSLPPIILSQPALCGLPGVDLDFLAPFRCLSIRNVLNIFALMLIEGRMLFVSKVSSLITEVGIR